MTSVLESHIYHQIIPSFCGCSITNEMIRCGWPHLQEYFIMFFNSILTSGKFPSPWDVNTLSPLHKKGSTLLRDNYRGIDVSSAIAKVFLSVLHNRLYKFADTDDLTPPPPPPIKLVIKKDYALQTTYWS